MDIITINKSLDYIEKHLSLKLTADMIAGHVMYSSYHFSRGFSDVMGITLKRYINGRKLMHILYHVQKGKRMLDMAFDYGFEDYSSFYKACKKTYGMSPKDCLSQLIFNEPKVFFIGKERYPMITEQKLKQIIKKWDLDDYSVKPVYSENRQQRKDLFLVDKYRIILTNNYNKLLESKRISEALNKEGIFTPKFIRNRDGEFFVQVDDQYLMLKEEVDHKTYSYQEIIASREVRQRLGESIGQLHMVLSTLEDNAIVTNSYDTCKNWALDEVRKLDVENPLPERFYDDYQAFESLAKSVPHSIIHRNPHLHNIYFKDHELMGYGDFYLTIKDMRIFDICYLATSILAEPGMDKEIWLDQYRDLVEGYNRIISLTDDELKAIPYMMYSIQMIVIAYFATQDAHQDLAIKNYELLEWMYENLA